MLIEEGLIYCHICGCFHPFWMDQGTMVIPWGKSTPFETVYAAN